MAIVDSEILQIVQVVVLLGGGGSVISVVSKAVAEFRSIGRQQADEIKELKEAMKQMKDLMVQMAVTTVRMDEQAIRMNRVEKNIDDLRRGEGFIMPLSRGSFEAPKKDGG